METVIGAFLGAVLGSIGAVVVREWFRRRQERDTMRRSAIERYLLQLQDAMESLWHRLDNVSRNPGKKTMEHEYFKESTLFALGSVLAYRRILLLDGVYQRINEFEPGLGGELRQEMRALEDALSPQMRHYHRLALAESVMERQGDAWHTRGFSDFRMRYENTRVSEPLEPAAEFVASLPRESLLALMDRLEGIVELLTARTGMPVSFQTELDDSMVP